MSVIESNKSLATIKLEYRRLDIIVLVTFITSLLTFSMFVADVNASNSTISEAVRIFYKMFYYVLLVLNLLICILFIDKFLFNKFILKIGNDLSFKTQGILKNDFTIPIDTIESISVYKNEKFVLFNRVVIKLSNSSKTKIIFIRCFRNDSLNVFIDQMKNKGIQIIEDELND